MSNDNLKNIINQASAETAKDYLVRDQIKERAKHLVDENGYLRDNDLTVFIISESMKYTQDFSYNLIKLLKSENYFDDEVE